MSSKNEGKISHFHTKTGNTVKGKKSPQHSQICHLNIKYFVIYNDFYIWIAYDGCEFRSIYSHLHLSKNTLCVESSLIYDKIEYIICDGIFGDMANEYKFLRFSTSTYFHFEEKRVALIFYESSFSTFHSNLCPNSPLPSLIKKEKHFM